MGKRTWIVLLLVTSLSLVAVVMATSGSAGGRPLSAIMTGPEEVPPGDPDGTGSASFTFNPGRGRVCFELEVANIAPATARTHPCRPAGSCRADRRPAHRSDRRQLERMRERRRPRA